MFEVRHGVVRALAVATGLFVAYYAAGRLGLQFASLAGTVSLIWPATGLAVAILYRYGLWHFPAVLLAAGAVYAPIHQWPVAIGIALGNCAATVLAAHVLRHRRFSPRLDHWSDTRLLTMTAVGTMTLSAANGTLWLFGAGSIGPPRLLDSFLLWWLGDATGVLMAAPLILAAPDFLRSKSFRKHWGKFLAATAVLIAVNAVLFLGWNPLGNWSLVVAFLPLLVILRVTFVHGAGAAAVQTAVLFGFVVYALNHAFGPISIFPPEARHLAVWAYLTAIAASSMTLAGLFDERMALERQFQIGEENYKALVEDNPALICRFTQDGRLAFANETFRRVFGITVGQTAGADFFVLAGLQGDLAFRNRLQVLRVNEPPATAENRVAAEPGERWFRWSARVTRESSGHGIEFHAVGLDVTDVVQAEAERRRIESEAVQAQKLESVGILAGGIAHEFNNLLTTILGNAELAGQLLPPHSEIRPLIDSAAGSARRAADLTRHLSNYAVRGSQPPEPLDISGLVRGTQDLFAIAVSKRCPLHIELSDTLPPVLADEMRLRQLLMSLVTNAGEAAAGCGAPVSIRTYSAHFDPALRAAGLLRGRLEPGPYVVLQVEDGGGGMTDSVFNRIFEPFFTTHQPGRGLGLAAVAAIVHDHGGAIAVCSHPGRGTCFRVLFAPLDAAACVFNRPVHAADCPYCPREAAALVDIPIEIALHRSAQIHSRNRRRKNAGSSTALPLK